MSRFWIVNLIDKIFISCCVFLAIFAWINFYVKNLWATFCLSLIFTFAIVFVLYYFLNKKHERCNLTKAQKQQMDKTILAFRLLKKEEQTQLIKKAISKEHEVKQFNNKLFFNDAFGKHLIVLATHLQKLDETEFLNVLAENANVEADCIDVFCIEHENLNTHILNNKKINLINANKIYTNYLTKHNIFPSTENLNTNVAKFKFKDLLNSMFLPNRAKSYFLCGLILIFSSIILPYHFYYIIFGSMLLLFAIICKILPKVK